jgi:hypothetical protein
MMPGRPTNPLVVLHRGVENTDDVADKGGLIILGLPSAGGHNCLAVGPFGHQLLATLQRFA